MKKTLLHNALAVTIMVFGCNMHAFSQANTSLSNLVSPTSVNQSLIPSTTNSKSLGTSAAAWKDGWFMGKLSIGGTVSPTTMLDITPPTTSTGGINLKPNSALIPSTSEIRFSELTSNGTNYVGFKSPSSIIANKIWILPAADGTSGQLLATNGSGTLSWASPSGISGLTTNFIPRWNGSSLVDGSLYDNGDKIGLGTVAPTAFLQLSKSGDADHPHIWVKEVSTDGYARIYLSSFSNLIGDETKWKILGRTSQTDENNQFYIQQVRNINGSYEGSTRFFIDYDGKMGLGTSVPAAKVHINTDYVGDEFIVGPETGTPHFIVDALGKGGFNVTDPNAQLHVNSDAGEDALRVQVNNTTKLFVSSNGGVSVGGNITPPTNGLYVTGNVGLGTSAPAVKLHINGTDEVLRLDGTNPYIQLFNSAVAKSYLQQTGDDFRLGTVGSNTSGKVQFTAGSSTVMTLKSSGKVGIGTASPSVLLHLKGSNGLLRLEGTDAYIDFNNSSTQKAFIQCTGNNLKIASNSGSIIFGNNVTGDQLFILSDGRIGMGTSTPKSGYKLSVEGKVACRELKVETASWPDYVFENDYKLLPLHELEHFISSNNHLPGIPSAQELEADGISVGDMQNKMMQKIEELTLYVIALQKQNATLADKVNSLEVK
ncbi:MAG: hypothetical protein IPO83_09295 [Chitinophagaceae bacterium]|nr:hypothetical protein [Chitinophagaceae bacterium]